MAMQGTNVWNTFFVVSSTGDVFVLLAARAVLDVQALLV
jgi:hypothetical protein